jgi:hypothetical protein
MRCRLAPGGVVALSMPNQRSILDLVAGALYRMRHFSILACRRCRQVYLRPLPSPERIREMFSRLYTAGEGSVPELKHYYEYCYEDVPDNPLVDRYELWLDAIERQCPPGRLLDVGCGTGLFLSVARRRGWEPFGIDDCAEATEHARHHFGIDVWVGEFADFPNQSACCERCAAAWRRVESSPSRCPTSAASSTWWPVPSTG